MVLVATALMLPLGWWVSQVAESQTEVALNQLDGKECPKVPVDTTYKWIGVQGATDSEGGVRITAVEKAKPASDIPGLVAGARIVKVDGAEVSDENGFSRLLRARKNKTQVQLTLVDGETRQPREVQLTLPDPDAVPTMEEFKAPQDAPADLDAPDGAGDVIDEAAADPAADAPAADEGGEDRPHAKIEVSIDSAELIAVEPPPEFGEAEIAAAKAKRSSCQTSIAAKRERIEEREGLIMLVLIIAGVLLVFGLAIYGIKMTHKVAGPLYKVGLYLAKLEAEKYDTVYNLRKGDQLVEFYEHFKAAHAGLTRMQEEDRDRLRDAVAVAKDADLASKSEELGKLIGELETLLAKKEESLGQ
jgi:hypothetical protein